MRTFFSSFSEAEGDTPRISYSLVSATLDMALLSEGLSAGSGEMERDTGRKRQL